MTFISIPFAVLFIVTMLLLWKCETKRQQQLILLLSSLIFYAWWDLRFLGLLLFQIIVCYVVALGISYRRKIQKSGKVFMILGVSVSLAVLGFFKYFQFFVYSFGNGVMADRISAMNIILPIGISFYTFLAISYIVDVYRKKIEADKSFLKVALYLSFFPQLLSGPITRAKDFFPQLQDTHIIAKKNIEDGIQIFMFGVVKKIVIADRLAVYTDAVFATPAVFSGGSIFCAVLSYSIQLYCDFSGYSDMAIGIARAMGFTLARNFNMPYLSKNPTEFWKRWHISLSAWLQEYVYISLGGNRKGNARTYLNLMVTMLLGGLWHGADWRFVIWGGLHGLALIIHKIYRKIGNKHKLYKVSPKLQKIVQGISIVVTCLFTCFCWIFFRANSLTDAILIIKRILTAAPGVQYIFAYFVIYLILVLNCYIVGIIKNKGNGYYILFDLKKFFPKIIICTIALLVAAFGYFGSNVFIYSQF